MIQKNIVLLDDHQMFLDGLQSMLSRDDRWCMKAVFRFPNDLISYLPNAHIDLLITDISMPQMNGIDVIRMVKEQYPNIKILVITMHADTTTIHRILKANPEGIVLKNASNHVLLEAVATICGGDKYFCKDVHDIIIASYSGQEPTSIFAPELSPREAEILKMIAMGKSNKDIAEEIFLSVYTIESYRKGLLKKMGAKNSAELIKKAVDCSLI